MLQTLFPEFCRKMKQLLSQIKFGMQDRYAYRPYKTICPILPKCSHGDVIVPAWPPLHLVVPFWMLEVSWGKLQ